MKQADNVRLTRDTVHIDGSYGNLILWYGVGGTAAVLSQLVEGSFGVMSVDWRDFITEG